MKNIKQLSKHIADNNLDEKQVEKLLISFAEDTYSYAIDRSYNRMFLLKRKLKQAKHKRMKKEFDTILTNIRDNQSIV